MFNSVHPIPAIILTLDYSNNRSCYYIRIYMEIICITSEDRLQMYIIAYKILSILKNIIQKKTKCYKWSYYKK